MSVLIDDSITIYEALENIKNGKYVMPAFQRQYVWSMEQIEKLWDSILLDYPIATFLFWHVDDDNVSWDTYFCNFLSEVTFDSRKQADSVNYELSSINVNLTDTAVLDGQQRLTTMFLLHWYAARRVNAPEDDCAFLQNFSYETRYSARDFCARLVGSYVPSFTMPISEEIIDQAWFPLDWQKDPMPL